MKSLYKRVSKADPASVDYYSFDSLNGHKILTEQQYIDMINKQTWFYLPHKNYGNEYHYTICHSRAKTNTRYVNHEMVTNNSLKREFVDDIIKVYKRHGMAIGHEDHHGAFIIEELSESLIKWLEDSLT